MDEEALEDSWSTIFSFLGEGDDGGLPLIGKLRISCSSQLLFVLMSPARWV
jgi:hypothetical protein